ncbi:cytochrome b [Amaricoccus sp.]|uniref:cytochrome b n=1 Tax=Amaricoccus sp. TaxID=1872485 RepID=UPI0025C34381|nr:cytochrome b [Amaricoccus sp.]
MSTLQDTPTGYGTVTRALHWGMAALFAWQFASAILRVVAEDTAIEKFFWSTHYSVGFTLWVLVLLRGAWGLANLRRRPRPEGSAAVARAARLGHLALYLLMIAVPSLALLRSAGSGRGLTVWGVEVIARGGEQVRALTAPGSALHAPLGWALLVLIVGHVAMALWHGHVRGDATLTRMTRGSSDRPAAQA